jgi:GH24 family phage-related lysozyme (muramidase)
MSQLEVKEKELNTLKQESDQLVLNQHPASDKIEVGIIGFIFLLGFGNFHKVRLYR